MGSGFVSSRTQSLSWQGAGGGRRWIAVGFSGTRSGLNSTSRAQSQKSPVAWPAAQRKILNLVKVTAFPQTRSIRPKPRVVAS